MKKPLTSHLYFWVLIAIVIGGVFGALDPEHAVKFKPLGDGFIALVRMLISPVIFCTVVLGIAGAGDMKKVGRVGGKALLYFETVSNVSLVIGLIVVNVLKPGAGFNVDPATLDTGAVVEIGRGSDEEAVARTARFVSTVRQVTSRYQRPLEYADLRHTDGYAVRLKGVSTLINAADKPQKK